MTSLVFKTSRLPHAALHACPLGIITLIGHPTTGRGMARNKRNLDNAIAAPRGARSFPVYFMNAGERDRVRTCVSFGLIYPGL